MALRPRGKGLLVRGYELPALLASQEPPSSAPLLLRDLWCYISFSLVHHPPTLVSHPCPHLSARPIGYSFWRSVSCCSPYRLVQGSHPHKWGQGVSCGYLIRRWQLLQRLLFHHAPMAGPLGSESPLGSSRRLPLATWCLPLLWFRSAEDMVVLGSISWQPGFPLFILGHFFLLSMGLGLDMKWAGIPKSFGPTIAPQNHAARLLEQGGRFWCSQAYVMAGWVLFPYGHQGLFACPRFAPGVSTVRGTLSLMLLWDDVDRFNIQSVYLMAPLWNGVDLADEGSLGNWAKFISLSIPSLSFVCGEFPKISPSI